MEIKGIRCKVTSMDCTEYTKGRIWARIKFEVLDVTTGVYDKNCKEISMDVPATWLKDFHMGEGINICITK